MTFGSRRDCAMNGRFQRFSLISARLGEGRLAGLNGSRFGRTDSAKQLEAATMTAILEARTARDSNTPVTPVFAAPIRHPSAWTVADFRSPADFLDDWAQRGHLEMLALQPVEANPSCSDAPYGSTDVALLRRIEVDRVIRW